MEFCERFNPDEELSENVRNRFYIDGESVEPRGTDRLTFISPITETVQLTLPAGGVEGMAVAVAAARRAFDTRPWSRTSPLERAGIRREAGPEGLALYLETKAIYLPA